MDLGDEIVVLPAQPFTPIGHLGESAQQRPALALGQSAPHPEGGVGVESLSKTLHANRARETQRSYVALLSALAEKLVWINIGARRSDCPGLVVVVIFLSP